MSGLGPSSRLVHPLVMSRRRDALVEAARAASCPITPAELADRLLADAPLRLIDVREADEVESGRIPGAVHVPRGWLELRVEALAAPEQELVVYCASGVRSALAAHTLTKMGYPRVRTLEGGVDAWKGSGRALEQAPTLSPDERRRYARHLLLPEVGEAGQLRLRAARVLVIGAGGLGSPAVLYLAAAGVGALGVVDDDVVDASNLHRQILHRDADAGVPKVDSAARAVAALNPSVRVETFAARFDAESAPDILAEGWDVVIDGTDLIPARYMINDACVTAGVPVVHGAIHRFEGQVSVFAPDRGGPCYRCLFPEAPPPEATPSCAEAGVIGALPGVIGTLQAMQALLLILGVGEPLVGRLLRWQGLEGRFEEIRFGPDPECPTCGGG